MSTPLDSPDQGGVATLDRELEELLREERPLSEIAIETGFADQSHFTRVFKRLTGRTPGAAREDDPIVQDKEDRAA